MPRLITSLVVTCLAAFSSAQSELESRLSAAFGSLRDQGQLYVRLSGAETVGDRATPLETWAFFNSTVEGTRPVLQFELRQFRNGILVQRQVGDGTSFWTYDPRSRTYTASVYGRFDGDYSSTNYATEMRRNLLDAITEASGSELAWVARLMREVFGGDAARYRSWLPGAEPIVGGLDSSDILLSLGDPPSRAVGFELNRTDGDVDRLLAIGYYDKRDLGARRRETIFRVDVVEHEGIPPAVSFAPYSLESLKGWRAIVQAKPVRQAGG